ncbi:MAG TPA: phosphate ABC transporter substrate-binding protein PstS [Stellaceae bacterium]|nr:phosphate ABC transporter substrate-binding protein PstS [Stellaceae bacterium]
MRGRLLAALVAVGLSTPAQAVTITGAGATFPYPLYAKWAEAYHAITGIGINYQSIGSGGGIRQINTGTVDFGASDMPLKPGILRKDGLVQWPQVMGGIVVVVNLRGIAPGQLRLDGATLAGMYLGRLKQWDDPAIKKLNPGIVLPDLAIATVHRADGSGTTFTFTHYLSEVDPEFRAKIGESTAVAFPGGLGGKGNEGVAALVARTDGAIGYVEYAFALQNRMTYTLLRNAAGRFVSPGADTFQAAAAHADWTEAPGFYLLLTNEPGRDSWPITSATFILLHRHQPDPEKTREILSFFDWAYHHGDAIAERLGYVPMPPEVTGLVEEMWQQKIVGPEGRPVWHRGGP